MKLLTSPQGHTSTSPTIYFGQDEIIRSDDARADKVYERRLNLHRSEELKTKRNASASKSPVMNDVSNPGSRKIAIC